MAGFDVSAAQLQAAAAHLEQLSRDIRDEYAPLQRQMETLLGEQWAGGAARGFESGWSEWQVGLDEVLTGLAGMSRLLKATGLTYEAAELDNADGVSAAGWAT